MPFVGDAAVACRRQVVGDGRLDGSVTVLLRRGEDLRLGILDVVA
jgi:hypothetical protein